MSFFPLLLSAQVGYVPLLRTLCKRGVPHALRSAVWKAVLCVEVGEREVSVDLLVRVRSVWLGSRVLSVEDGEREFSVFLTFVVALALALSSALALALALARTLALALAYSYYCYFYYNYSTQKKKVLLLHFFLLLSTRLLLLLLFLLQLLDSCYCHYFDNPMLGSQRTKPD